MTAKTNFGEALMADVQRKPMCRGISGKILFTSPKSYFEKKTSVTTLRNLTVTKDRWNMHLYYGKQYTPNVIDICNLVQINMSLFPYFLISVALLHEHFLRTASLLKKLFVTPGTKNVFEFSFSFSIHFYNQSSFDAKTFG